MPPIRVVLDTNVVVSAVINEAGFEAAVLAACLSGKIIQLYLSEPILDEYQGVLGRPKFRLQPATVNDLIKEITSAAELVDPKRRVTWSIDPKDNMFLECAEVAEAHYLVTGNMRHFPPKHWKKTEIVNARGLFMVIFRYLNRHTP